jgi:hypothetical protein
MSIQIERRDSREVTHIEGWTDDGRRLAVRLTPQASPAANYAFDVTPARLVTALVTERGLCPASRAGRLDLFPERGAVTAAAQPILHRSIANFRSHCSRARFPAGRRSSSKVTASRPRDRHNSVRIAAYDCSYIRKFVGVMSRRAGISR